MAKSKPKTKTDDAEAQEAKDTLTPALAHLTSQIGTPDLGPVIAHCEAEFGLELHKSEDGLFTTAVMYGVDGTGRGGEREALEAWCAKVRRNL